MNVGWITDPHMDFAVDPDEFLSGLARFSLDALLVGGDISNSTDYVCWLQKLSAASNSPVYFVLGNHDCYGSSIERARSLARQTRDPLLFLEGGDPVELTNSTSLVGHGLWADAGCGDYARSKVMLADYTAIKDFKGLGKSKRRALLEELGSSAAAELQKSLVAALDCYEQVLCLTHVPPFKQATWHEGKVSSDDYLPHFCCKAAGEMMLCEMQKRPKSKLRVLCGHTHGEGYARIADNIEVFTGGANYCYPLINSVFKMPTFWR